MQILKGAEVSSAIKERVQEQLAGLKAGIPRLAIVRWENGQMIFLMSGEL